MRRLWHQRLCNLHGDTLVHASRTNPLPQLALRRRPPPQPPPPLSLKTLNIVLKKGPYSSKLLF